MPCAGNSEDHCCYVNGKPCRYLEKNTVEGRVWACGLRRKLGDWDAVLSSAEYRRDVAPVFEPLGLDCKSYPIPGQQYCGTCGVRNGR